MVDLNEKKNISPKILYTLGIPTFLIAVVISVATHRYAHLFIHDFACRSIVNYKIDIQRLISVHVDELLCPLGHIAGPAWSLIFALLSFSLYLRFNRNLLFGSLAFINASMRIQESVTVFIQLLISGRAKLYSDESVALTLLQAKDPALSLVIIFFYSITTLYLTITIVQDTKAISYKWLIASVLFIAISPLDYLLWKISIPYLWKEGLLTFFLN